MSIAATPTGAGLPSLSRRQLLVAAGVAGATAVLAGTGRGLDGVRIPDLAEALVASTFLPVVGREFRFAVPSQDPVRLRLAAVEGLAGAPATERSFTLRFDGPAASRQGGQVGLLRTTGLPVMPLLVVPNGLPAAGGQEWTVTVNGADG